jgi:hypothetical protein
LLINTATPLPLAAQSSDQNEIGRAFSLIGHWTIVKMDVTLMTATGTSPLPEASSGTVTVDIGSSLAEGGSFDVQSDGTITGSGTANYRFRVAAHLQRLQFLAAMRPVFE